MQTPSSDTLTAISDRCGRFILARMGITSITYTGRVPLPAHDIFADPDLVPVHAEISRICRRLKHDPQRFLSLATHPVDARRALELLGDFERKCSTRVLS